MLGESEIHHTCVIARWHLRVLYARRAMTMERLYIRTHTRARALQNEDVNEKALRELCTSETYG